MTDIQLMHGNDDFYSIQKKEDWKKLSRIDRHIYFLSTGSNSCTDIAFLLKVEREFVRNRLCLLRIQNYIQLRKNPQDIIHIDALQVSFELIQPFRTMFVQQFYTLMIQEFSELKKYILDHHVTMSQLESEFFTFVKFLIQVAEQTSSNVKTLQSIVSGYKLCRIDEKELDKAIYCFLKAFAHCLQTSWNNYIEDSWKRICIIVEYAILALCQ